MQSRAKFGTIAAITAVTFAVCRGAQAQQEKPPPSEPAEVRYRENDPIPGGFHIETRRRIDIAVAGALVLAIPYGLSVGLAADFDFPNRSRWLLVPAAGPFITLGARDGCGEAGRLECFADGMLVVLLVADGLAQTVGAVALGAGLYSTREVLVRDDGTIRIVPTRIGSAYGVGVAGSF